jgi:hypothetical protein
MTFSQLIPYLGFASSSLLAYVVWMRWLTSRRRGRVLVPELLLNGRERFELEQTTIEALQRQILNDERARQQFVTAYLPSVSNLGNTLAQRIRLDSETMNRFLFNAISSLDDDSLKQLAELLRCPRAASRIQMPRPTPSRHPIWLCRQQATAIFGLGALALMLLAPPWVAQLERQTRVVGGGRSTQLLAQTSIGYRWLNPAVLHAPQTTIRPTHDLRRFEQEVYAWRIDYVRLLAQLIAWTLACSVDLGGLRRRRLIPCSARTGFVDRHLAASDVR